jgi:hypothetical protein
MTQDSVGHGTDNVQGEQGDEGTIADCLGVFIVRIIYETTCSEVLEGMVSADVRARVRERAGRITLSPIVLMSSALGCTL